MILSLYRWGSTLGGPVILAYLGRRLRRGKEDPYRFGERVGKPSMPRPEGRLTWVHAASVGEAMSVLPLIERIRKEYPDTFVLLTTGTVTSARLMVERLPGGARHQFVPVDRVSYVRKFLDHWRPDVAIWAESEFWPNLLCEVSARKIPLVLVNGRISDRSFARWRRYPQTIAKLLSCFVHCMGQSQTDVERLKALGAEGATCPGNLKHAVPPLPVNPDGLAELKAAIGDRRVWLAASTHAGEEEICGRVKARLAPEFPNLLTVIVPRHPERGAEIAETLHRMGLRVAGRSRGHLPEPETDVYLADTIGELGLFYRLAEIAFIGKSLVSSGGQNPLEAAVLGCPVVFGPKMTNFRDMSQAMMAAGAAEQVDDPDGLAEAVGRLLADDALRGQRGQAGMDFAAGEAQVLDRVMDEIAPFLRGAGREA